MPAEALLTVTHPSGSVNAHRIAPLTDTDRCLVAPIYEEALAAARCTPAQFLVTLSDHIADHQAYERVCAAKGLLPL